MTMSEHLHSVDYPLTIRILNELLARRTIGGFLQLPSHVNVDWLAIGHGCLSATEKAVVEIAHGISVIERCGGGSPAWNHWGSNRGGRRILTVTSIKLNESDFGFAGNL